MQGAQQNGPFLLASYPPLLQGYAKFQHQADNNSTKAKSPRQSQLQ